MFERLRDFFIDGIRSRSFLLVVVFCLLFSLLLHRVFYLQIIMGQEYAQEYQLKIQKVQEVQGTRGNIYDRNGNLLAYNELAYSVTLEDNGSYDSSTKQEKNEGLNSTIVQLIQIIEGNGDSISSEFGIVLDEAGAYAYENTGTSKLRFLADIYGYTTIDKLSEEQRVISAEDLIEYLCTDKTYGYGISQEEYSKELVLKIVNIRYNLSLNAYQKYVAVTVASDVSDKTVAAVMEQKDTLAGIDIQEEYLRRYTDSEYFSSLIGYTGKISTEEYDAFVEEGKEQYSKTDIVGKAGLEQSMDEYLQGEKGEEIFYVDSVGKVIETEQSSEAGSGNDLYLTIDKDLQIATYQLLEEKLAGIVTSKLQNVLTYDPSTAEDSSDIIIPIGDVYYAFLGNEILSLNHLATAAEGTNEQALYNLISTGRMQAVTELLAEFQNANGVSYANLSESMQDYVDYIQEDLLTESLGILLTESIDTDDATYQAWSQEQSISFYTWMNYAISKGWVDTATVAALLEKETKYSDAGEIYQDIMTLLSEYLSEDIAFEKLVCKYMIQRGEISGTILCLCLYEQGVITYDESQFQRLASGALHPYDFVRGKIQTLEITPGQLGLEPCSASAVVTDPNTGAVLACVSYPGYDANRLANTMDTEYYNQLNTSTSSPFYNKATQERTAPGSTYKMLSSVAGLTEGVIDLTTYISCQGEYDKVEPHANCWIYPEAHGSLDVTSALQYSCNYFFYEVGYRLGLKEDGTYSSTLGIEKLEKYAKEFGLDGESGVEIPETTSKISDAYSVPSAIGQGTNNFTTCQLARYVSTVANGGTVYNLTLVDHIESASEETIQSFAPEVVNEMTEVSETTWEAVQQGMRNMVSASSTFSNGISWGNVVLAGKTGTAQQSKTHADHALFVGFAKDSGTDEIALAVRIANGYNSSYAAEIGRDIVQYYYGLAEKGELITGSSAELGAAGAGD